VKIAIKLDKFVSW